MSRQNSNTSSVSPMLSSCDPPRSFPCRDIVVLPVRYALCSDKESSLGHAYHAFTRRFCPAAEMRHHYYTLRLLRPLSFLYAYVEGEADIVQFAVDGQSELRWKRGNSFMLRAERFWLRVSNLNQSVWLAVSDADWTDEFMTKVKGNPAPHMQQFCPATGNSEESLVVLLITEAERNLPPMWDGWCRNSGTSPAISAPCTSTRTRYRLPIRPSGI